MFSLLKLAIHRHREGEELKDVRWTCFDPVPPAGLRLGVHSGCLKISNGEEEILDQMLGPPNKTVVKGAFGGFC